MHVPARFLPVLFLLLLSGRSEARDPDPAWTHFRGNDLNGISVDTGIPVHWNDSVNMAWHAPLEGKGWSSPLVLGEQVWLTTATGGGKEMRALCVDFSTGALVHDIVLFEPDSLYRIHAVNSYATPTGALEEGRVYLHFGRYGTACLDTESGAVLWKRTDMQCEHIQGPGSSLLIHGNKLIVHMEGSDIQYILALDKRSGQTLWRVERPQELYDKLEYIGKKAYITPIVVKSGDRELMISNGAAVCIAYDVETGEEVWRIVYGEDSTIAMPTESDGRVYFYTGFETQADGEDLAQLIAVDPGGEGDVEQSHELWRMGTPRLQLLTPVVVDELLYTINSKSMMQCLDAATGETIWSKKMKGKFHSSPVYADGKIYFCSTRGYTYVMKAGREALELGENRLKGEIWATPAIAGGALLIRTSEGLYKILKDTP